MHKTLENQLSLSSLVKSKEWINRFDNKQQALIYEAAEWFPRGVNPYFAKKEYKAKTMELIIRGIKNKIDLMPFVELGVKANRLKKFYKILLYLLENDPQRRMIIHLAYKYEIASREKSKLIKLMDENNIKLDDLRM